ncbi:MAG TPA: sodium:dicarboxylate symporter [Ignavibacteriales bacterium]|nr:sodium:dicarboxylate symporter [Ignavibacteriales bacterium]
MQRVQKLGFVVGLISFIIILIFFNPDPANPNVGKVAAVAVLMAIWWITEALPMAATSLVPLVFFPLLGVLSGSEISGSYINSVIFLFVGGFMLAIAMENWGLHKRIALKIISIFGGTPNSILFGFMLSAAFLSMWISNTATAVMMLPIALAVITKIENEFGKDETKKFSKSVLLGIAYSCSIGGIATLIGTPPNLALVRIHKIAFPDAPQISFGDWMLLALPITVILLILTAILLSKIVFKSNKKIEISKDFIANEYKSLGKISFPEKVIAIVFSITSLLWIFRADLNLGFTKITGWSSIFSVPDFIDDGTIAITMAFLLFLFPSKDERQKTILAANVFEQIPWGIILLFGGGFALATAFSSSGLSEYIGNNLRGLSNIPTFILIIVICAIINFLTELTSNTATTQMILPILASVSVAIGLNPLLLMISATLSASMAFMMPVGTPPNTIVFASKRLRISDMAKTGFALNIISVIIIALFVYFIGSAIFNLNTFPSWARTN